MVSSFEIGCVYHHPNFVFKDGETSPKRLIVLGKSKEDDRVYLIKTTSQPRFYSECHDGCNSERQIYLLRANRDVIFERDTYIQLSEPSSVLETESILDENFTLLGKLNEDIFNRIKSCFSTLREEVSVKLYNDVFPKR